MKLRTIAPGVVLLASAMASAQVSLGSFTFDADLFGDTLVESDGGSFSSANWLNTVNSDPGNPGYLTGANFDTGIANISSTTYTIGYDTGILNAAGDDLGIVVARFSDDPFELSFSINGVDFTTPVTIQADSAVDSGETRDYFYSGGGPFNASLFVHMLDLSDFGFSEGDSIVGVRITGTTQLDLIRAAGVTAVPEPGTIAVLGLGAAWLVRRRRPK